MGNHRSYVIYQCEICHTKTNWVSEGGWPSRGDRLFVLVILTKSMMRLSMILASTTKQKLKLMAIKNSLKLLQNQVSIILM